jgi:hypothetical protein
MSNTLTKPTLANKTTSAAALAFAEAGAEVKPVTPVTITEKRAFFAPEGHQRLTINLPKELHKKLRLQAVEQDCTATDIIMRLLTKELGA